jgi:hypothetical protein
MKYAATPLWLSVYGSHWRGSNRAAARKVLASLEIQAPPKMFLAADGFPTVPLFLPSGVERATVVQAAADQIESVSVPVAPLVDTSGGPPIAPPPDEMQVG